MLGDLISAGASIIGGLIGKSSADSAREATERMAQQNIQLQREFAQNGLTWKIDDAFRNADRVHPIYSLGSSGASFSPVSANFTADTSMSNAVSSAGQNIGRAVNAALPESQRNRAFTAAVQDLQLEGGKLDNELKRAQLASEVARLRQAPNPPMPIGDRYLIPGQSGSGVQGGSGLVQDQPMKRTNVEPSAPHQEPGAKADIGYARTSAGGYYPIPSKDVKESIEDNFPHEIAHFIRNNLLQMAQVRLNPPFAAPAGKSWLYSPVDGYVLVDMGDAHQKKFNRYMNYITGRR